jgi:anti-sigma regulatory factor (Ser/Thr protein kinase)
VGQDLSDPVRGAGSSKEPDGPLVGGHLTYVLESSAPVALVRLTGRLDLLTAIEARAALHKALAEQPTAIVVDLAGVSVDDDVVLTVFSAVARTAAGWPGCPVLLADPDARLRAGLDRMAVSRAVPVYPDRTGALAAAQAGPGPLRFQQRLPASPHAGAAARQIVVDACRSWRLPELADDGELVVTELVANAQRHAGGDVELAVVLRERFLHLAVHDRSPEPPRMVLPDVESAEGGRGLILVDALAAAWGSTPAPDGKHVWATLRVAR